jgi:hypothetical protein
MNNEGSSVYGLVTVGYNCVCFECSVWLFLKYERLSYLETVSVDFMFLFYSSNSSCCGSKILFFRPAVIKCRYVLEQVFCDFFTFEEQLNYLANCY